jgi:hypothetical protein
MYNAGGAACKRALREFSRFEGSASRRLGIVVRMGPCARGGWLALAAVLGCGPAPSEVIGPPHGSSAAGSDGSGGGTSGGATRGDTGPVADASAGSGTPDTTQGNATEPVDAGTTSATGRGTTDTSSSDGAAPATCDEIFGAAPGYVLCEFDDTSCRFNVTTGGQSCTTICASYGQTCLDALDNPSTMAEACVVQGGSTCGNSSKSTTLCVCTR